MPRPAGQEKWLVIAEEAFIPADSGGRVETLNLLRSAAAAGIQLHVLVPGLSAEGQRLHEDAVPTATLSALPRRTGWRSHASLRPFVFTSRPLPAGLIDGLGAAPDAYTAVVSASFRVAHLGTALAEGLALPLVVRPHNIESGYFRALAAGLGPVAGLPYRLESWKLRWAERRLHASPTVTLFADISLEDALQRQRRTSSPVIHVPPFLSIAGSAGSPGVTPAPDSRGDSIVFIGSLDNGNNREAIAWFVRECWPRLRVSATISCHIVGRRAPPGLREELESAGIVLSTDVPDVSPYLSAASVFINPVRHGAGVNIKMVEAMAAGVAVVTTSVGARGLHWRPGEHLLVADDAEAFGAAVLTLLRDRVRRQHLAAAGRSFVSAELDGARLIDVVRRGLAG